jgi:hypothetical protein
VSCIHPAIADCSDPELENTDGAKDKATNGAAHTKDAMPTINGTQTAAAVKES